MITQELVKYSFWYEVEKFYVGTQIQRKRLKRFINYLKGINPKYFDIGVIIQCEDSEKPKFGTCQTAACAIGHLPDFNPNRFTTNRRFDKYSNNHCVIDKITKDSRYLNIGQNYFGLTRGQSFYCFDGGAYCEEFYSFNVKPKHVVERLQGLLEGKIYKARGYKG